MANSIDFLYVFFLTIVPLLFLLKKTINLTVSKSMKITNKYHESCWNCQWKMQLQSPLVIVDSSVILKMSSIIRESTILREIQAKIDNQSTKHIHYNKRFHYYEIHITLLQNAPNNVLWVFFAATALLMTIKFDTSTAKAPLKEL